MKSKVLRVALGALASLAAISLFVALVGLASVSLLAYALDGKWLYVALYIVTGDLVLASALICGTMLLNVYSRIAALSARMVSLH